MIKEQLSAFKKVRENFLKALEDIPYEKMQIIPPNFNNTIMWNFVHTYVSQQLLIYRNSAVEIKIAKNLVVLYAKGTKPPKEKLLESDFLAIKKDFIKQTETLKEDYENGVFKNYQQYETSYGLILKNAEDAIFFNNLHENIHYGYVLAMKKIIP